MMVTVVMVVEVVVVVSLKWLSVLTCRFHHRHYHHHACPSLSGTIIG